MQSKLMIGGLIISPVILLAWWFQSPQPTKWHRESSEAWVTRPTELEPGVQDSFTLNVDGVDWKVGPIVFRSGESCHFTGELDERIVGGIPTEPGTLKMAAILIVPRLIEQGDEGFRWMDVRVDRTLGFNNRVGDSRYTLDEKIQKILWAPGEYRVRLMLRTMVTGPDRVDPVEWSLIHESKMTVHPGKSNTEVFIPLDSPKSLIPLTLKSKT